MTKLARRARSLAKELSEDVDAALTADDHKLMLRLPARLLRRIVRAALIYTESSVNDWIVEAIEAELERRKASG
jgi:predicted HicB family RNase H-like nuclease